MEEEFSYNIVCPILRYSICHGYGCGNNCRNWHIYEKGSAKKRRRYKILYNTIQFAMRVILFKGIKKMFLTKSSLCRNEGFNVYLINKLEQHSIKTRGIIYTLLQLSAEQKHKGMITISTCTFALILCRYGREFNISVTIVIPTSTTEENVKMCQAIADTVFTDGQDLKESHIIALNIAMTKGLYYIDGNDHPDIIIGQGTLGIDICEQVKEEAAIILPTTIDGCALTMGIALTIKKCKPNIQIYEAMPELPEIPNVSQDYLIQDLRTKTTVLNELVNIIPKKYKWYHDITCLVNMCFNDVVKVKKSEIEMAKKLLEEKNIIDDNAAIGLAAILSGMLNALKEKKIILPVFGKMD